MSKQISVTLNVPVSVGFEVDDNFDLTNREAIEEAAREQLSNATDDGEFSINFLDLDNGITLASFEVFEDA